MLWIRIVIGLCVIAISIILLRRLHKEQVVAPEDNADGDNADGESGDADHVSADGDRDAGSVSEGDVTSGNTDEAEDPSDDGEGQNYDELVKTLGATLAYEAATETASYAAKRFTRLGFVKRRMARLGQLPALAFLKTANPKLVTKLGARMLARSGARAGVLTSKLGSTVASRAVTRTMVRSSLRTGLAIAKILKSTNPASFAFSIISEVTFAVLDSVDPMGYKNYVDNETLDGMLRDAHRNMVRAANQANIELPLLFPLEEAFPNEWQEHIEGTLYDAYFDEALDSLSNCPGVEWERVQEKPQGQEVTNRNLKNRLSSGKKLFTLQELDEWDLYELSHDDYVVANNRYFRPVNRIGRHWMKVDQVNEDDTVIDSEMLRKAIEDGMMPSGLVREFSPQEVKVWGVSLDYDSYVVLPSGDKYKPVDHEFEYSFSFGQDLNPAVETAVNKAFDEALNGDPQTRDGRVYDALFNALPRDQRIYLARYSELSTRSRIAVSLSREGVKWWNSGGPMGRYWVEYDVNKAREWGYHVPGVIESQALGNAIQETNEASDEVSDEDETVVPSAGNSGKNSKKGTKGSEKGKKGRRRGKTRKARHNRRTASGTHGNIIVTDTRVDVPHASRGKLFRAVVGGATRHFKPLGDHKAEWYMNYDYFDQSVAPPTRLGSAWHLQEQPPAQGTELENQALSTKLHSTLNLTDEQLDDLLENTELSEDHYVPVRGKYAVPGYFTSKPIAIFSKTYMTLDADNLVPVDVPGGRPIPQYLPAGHLMSFCEKPRSQGAMKIFPTDSCVSFKDGTDQYGIGCLYTDAWCSSMGMKHRYNHTTKRSSCAMDAGQVISEYGGPGTTITRGIFRGMHKMFGYMCNPCCKPGEYCENRTCTKKKALGTDVGNSAGWKCLSGIAEGLPSLCRECKVSTDCDGLKPTEKGHDCSVPGSCFCQGSRPENHKGYLCQKKKMDYEDCDEGWKCQSGTCGITKKGAGKHCCPRDENGAVKTSRSSAGEWCQNVADGRDCAYNDQCLSGLCAKPRCVAAGSLPDGARAGRAHARACRSGKKMNGFCVECTSKQDCTDGKVCNKGVCTVSRESQNTSSSRRSQRGRRGRGGGRGTYVLLGKSRCADLTSRNDCLRKRTDGKVGDCLWKDDTCIPKHICAARADVSRTTTCSEYGSQAMCTANQDCEWKDRRSLNPCFAKSKRECNRMPQCEYNRKRNSCRTKKR